MNSRMNDSFEIASIRGRNSNCSEETQRFVTYGASQMNHMDFEKFDAELGQHLDNVFAPVPSLLLRGCSIQSDPADYFLNNNSKGSKMAN